MNKKFNLLILYMILSIKTAKYRIAVIQMAFILAGIPMSTALSQDWTVQESGTTVRLNGVFFIDENNGWIVGDSSLILHTFNGGEEWIEQNSPVDSITFNKVSFLNS